MGKWKPKNKMRQLYHLKKWTVSLKQLTGNKGYLALFFWGGGQEYWSGLPFPSPGDLPNPGIEPGSPALQADALPSEPPGKSYNDEEVNLSRRYNNDKKELHPVLKHLNVRQILKDLKEQAGNKIIVEIFGTLLQ